MLIEEVYKTKIDFNKFEEYIIENPLSNEDLNLFNNLIKQVNIHTGQTIEHSNRTLYNWIMLPHDYPRLSLIPTNDINTVIDNVYTIFNMR